MLKPNRLFCSQIQRPGKGLAPGLLAESEKPRQQHGDSGQDHASQQKFGRFAFGKQSQNGDEHKDAVVMPNCASAS